MELTFTEESGVRILEGPPDSPLMRRVDDVGLLIEECLNNRVRSVLLYTPNLPDGFFDLSSGEAGEILQKLRQYRIRLAIVCALGAVRFSRRFGDMMIEESRASYVRLFGSIQPAREWLSQE